MLVFDESVFLGYDASSLGEGFFAFWIIFFPLIYKGPKVRQVLEDGRIAIVLNVGLSHLVTQWHIPEKQFSPTV